MPIPIEVSYTTFGKKAKKVRNVIGVICPTALCLGLKLNRVEPIYVNMGDVSVDWGQTSPGFEMLGLEKLTHIY